MRISTHEKSMLTSDRKFALMAIKYVIENDLEKTQKVLLKVKAMMRMNQLSNSDKVTALIGKTKVVIK